MDLPPILGRLRLPVVTTGSKLSAEDDNQSALERFIAEHCERTPEKHTLFSEFFAAFQKWLGKSDDHADEKGFWTKVRVGKELPVRHQKFHGNYHKTYISNLTLKPAEGGKL
jgi:hypothetical protein